MVENKKTKRERDIKAKLMAAIAMLLVSSIMMVSTTYAWFTLSTAPEVTGITTAVGANGNLEMALMPAVKSSVDGEVTYYALVAEALASIKTGSGDSMAIQDKHLANITWGNLVDLTTQGENTYGMEQIVLYPSALDLPEGSMKLTEGSLLKIPEYGSDGRVAKLNGIGSNGTYVKDGFYENTGFGVRAIGKSSGMTARKLAWTAAKATADSAANAVSGAAGNSLDKGGNALASMAMKYNMAADKNSVTFTDEELTKIVEAYDALLATNGSVGYLKTAMRNYVKAAIIATATDETYENLTKDLDTMEMSALQNLATTNGYTELATIIGHLITLENDIVSAKTNIQTLIAAEADADWNAVYPSLKILGDPNTMTLQGTPIPDIVDDLETYVPVLIQGMQTGLKLVIEGDSIYVDIANFCGKISAGVIIEDLYYNGLGGDFPATMEANNTVIPPYMSQVKTAVNAIAYDDGENGGSETALPISNFYGYIVDMAFRTNAADSYLQLQTEAEDRIYQGNTANPETMGGGSTMSFSFEAGSATNATIVKSMMAGIRVVFFDPSDYTVKQFARLDWENATQTEEVVEEEGSEPVTVYTLTAKLFLCDAEGNWLEDVEGTNQNETNALIPLPQNTAVALSALVYLDGETIGNESVSTENIVGKMNLQFSSSATLTPMDYSDLREGSGETPAELQG